MVVDEQIKQFDGHEAQALPLNCEPWWQASQLELELHASQLLMHCEHVAPLER